jgi:para-nitrobenzyl esterase
MVDGGVRVFLGVAYGASTGGAARFGAPRPAESWDGVRDALVHGRSAWQRGPADDAQREMMRGSLAMWGGQPEASMGEDCLVLNVWAPAGVTEPLPVLVYLHGGGHSLGAGSWPAFDGRRLAARGDVVVVTLNHRLGVLAYCSLAEVLGPDYTTSGINGILDIVEALRWVRANIAEVGGDPERVLVYGQSGGGAKTAALLAVPSSYGLYQRLGIMSAPNPTLLTPDAGTDATALLLEHLGIRPEDAEQLLTLPAERLIEAQGAIGGPLGPFAPVLDGTWAVAQPSDAVATGRAPGMPLLIGTTRDEQMTFMATIPEPPDANDAWVAEQMRRSLGDDAEAVVAAYRALHADASPRRLLVRVATDAGIRLSSIRFAEAWLAGGQAPAFMYRFDWETRAAGYEGTAPHGGDQTFFFDNLAVAGVSAGGPQRLADHASSALVAFAASGSPNYDDAPEWPPYDTDRRATMVLDTESCVADDPDADARSILTGVEAQFLMT